MELPVHLPRQRPTWRNGQSLKALQRDISCSDREQLKGALGSASSLCSDRRRTLSPDQCRSRALSSIDRLIFVCLYRLRPGIREALAIVKPETVVKWHRSGFRLYWRWKSKARGGRPTVPLEIRKLIREMSIANPLWGLSDECSVQPCIS
jgi:hypothetical protein